MKSYLVVMGAGGARVAEAAVYTAMAGLWPADSLRLVLVNVGDTDERRLRALCVDYMTVRSLYDVTPHTGYGPSILLMRWPDGESVGSLRGFCEKPEDRLLLRALFTPPEAETEGLNGASNVVGLNWERLLHGESPNGVMAAIADSLRDEPEETRLLLCGSLCEPCCAAGAPALLRWLRERGVTRRVGKVLLLPVCDMDDASVARSALAGLEGQEDGLCLIGMPDDCLAQCREAHLTDWLAARACGLLLQDGPGALAFRIPMGKPDWTMFGTGSGMEAWRAGWERTVRAAFLLLTDYGPAAQSQLSSPNWLRDRMNTWYSAFFGGRMPASEREQNLKAMQAAARLSRSLVAWLRQLQQNMPVAMRCSAGLHQRYLAVAEHYDAVLNTYGQLALLEHDIRISGMDEEDVVHRLDNALSEAETARKQAEDLRSHLIAQMQAQEEMNRQLGSRMKRVLLEEAVTRCQEQEEAVGEQLADAERRIDEAAEKAGESGMARVAAARGRLELLRHHLIALENRTLCARKDLQRAIDEGGGTILPAEGDGLSAPAEDMLFDPEMLTGLLSLEQRDGRSERLMVQQLEAAWPWPELEPDAIRGKVLSLRDSLSGVLPAGVLLHALATACEA